MSLRQPYKGKWPCTTSLLYDKDSLIGRVHQYFFAYFETFPTPTAETLFLLVLSILAMESVRSIRFLYKHFLSGITEKSLNAFYYACAHAKMDYFRFTNVTVSMPWSWFRNAWSRSLSSSASMTRWQPSSGNSSRTCQNSSTMTHITAAAIWMDTASSASCSVSRYGGGTRFRIWQSPLGITCEGKRSPSWGWQHPW